MKRREIFNPRKAQGWGAMMDVVWLALFLGLATFLKRQIRFFRRFLIPNSIIAGFLGLIFGPQILNWISFSPERLLKIVYHLMAIGFIALSLRSSQKIKHQKPVTTGAAIVSTYVLQGILGLVTMLILFMTILPKIFVPMGLFLPLGYGQGPGQALSIGLSWEHLYSAGGIFRGLSGGANIGVTIATFGFLWACFIGIPLMNILVRRYGTKKKIKKKHCVVHQDLVEIEKKGDVPLGESIDRISIQIFLIAIAYALTYGTLYLASLLLSGAGPFAQNLARMLWGFHFIFGALFGLGLRLTLEFLKKKNIMVRNYPNDYLLKRIAGGAFDFMITAAIAAISLPVLVEYAVPILILTSVGGIGTLFYALFVARRFYPKYFVEYTLGFFGMLTGTISTGIALLKEVDPKLKTPVSEDLVLGSGTALFFGIPVMMIIPYVVEGYTEQKISIYWISIALLILTFFLLLGIMIFLSQKKKKGRK